MNKQAYLKEVYDSALNDELDKIAKIDLSDVEDRIGYYMPDSVEGQARDLISQESNKRFGVRHPWMTGLPTLGIWPAISKSNAISKVIARLARSNPEAAKLISKGNADRKAEYLQSAKLQIEADKANQFSNAVAASVLPILAAKD